MKRRPSDSHSRLVPSGSSGGISSDSTSSRNSRAVPRDVEEAHVRQQPPEPLRVAAKLRPHAPGRRSPSGPCSCSRCAARGGRSAGRASRCSAPPRARRSRRAAPAGCRAAAKIIDVPTTSPLSASAATKTKQRSARRLAGAARRSLANDRRERSMIAASAARSSGRFTESRWTAARCRSSRSSGAMSRRMNMAARLVATAGGAQRQGRWRADRPGRVGVERADQLGQAARASTGALRDHHAGSR